MQEIVKQTQSQTVYLLVQFCNMCCRRVPSGFVITGRFGPALGPKLASLVWDRGWLMDEGKKSCQGACSSEDVGILKPTCEGMLCMSCDNPSLPPRPNKSTLCHADCQAWTIGICHGAGGGTRVLGFHCGRARLPHAWSEGRRTGLTLHGIRRALSAPVTLLRTSAFVLCLLRSRIVWPLASLRAVLSMTEESLLLAWHIHCCVVWDRQVRCVCVCVCVCVQGSQFEPTCNIVTCLQRRPVRLSRTDGWRCVRGPR